MLCVRFVSGRPRSVAWLCRMIFCCMRFRIYDGLSLRVALFAKQDSTPSDYMYIYMYIYIYIYIYIYVFIYMYLIKREVFSVDLQRVLNNCSEGIGASINNV